MADTQFAIIFQGQIADGADPAAVRANLAKLFKADAARIEKMFSGQKVVIKKGLDSVAAGKYKIALGKAGAVVEAVAMKAAAATPPPAATPAAPTAPRSPIPPAPQTVPSAYADKAPPAALDTSMAEPGETLVEYERRAVPDIATDHLSMAAAGETLVEAQVTPEPDFDLSGMTLDPPGTTLAEAVPIAEPDFDLSGMSLDDNP